MKLKEQLVSMGLTEEQAQKVIDEIIDGAYVPKSRFNEVNEELKTAKSTIAERDKQLKALEKAAGDNEDLQKQIKDLQKENKEQQQKHESEIAQMRLDNATDAALTAAGAKNLKAVRSLLDASKLSLAGDGTVTGLNEQLTALRQSDGYLFNTQQKFKGYQPGASGDQKPGDKADTSKMTYDELCAYLAENPDVEL